MPFRDFSSTFLLRNLSRSCGNTPTSFDMKKSCWNWSSNGCTNGVGWDMLRVGRNELNWSIECAPLWVALALYLIKFVCWLIKLLRKSIQSTRAIINARVVFYFSRIRINMKWIFCLLNHLQLCLFTLHIKYLNMSPK